MSGPVEPGCLFCQIVVDEVPAIVVAETPSSVAFRDIAPAAPTHVLVVPRAHVRDAAALVESDGALLADLFALAARVARSEGLAERGYRLVLNVGEDAGNTVEHLHVHLIGGRHLDWPPG